MPVSRGFWKSKGGPCRSTRPEPPAWGVRHDDRSWAMRRGRPPATSAGAPPAGWPSKGQPRAGGRRRRDHPTFESRVPILRDAGQEQITGTRADPVRAAHDGFPFRVHAGVGHRDTPKTSPASAPKVGIQAQLCGDAHLANFGAYASLERALLFDLNDFDETLPGPLGVGRQTPGPASWWPAGTTRFDAEGCPQPAAQASRGLIQGSGWPSSRRWESSRSGTRESARRNRAGVLSDARGGNKTTRKVSETARRGRGRDHLQALSKLTRVTGGRRHDNRQPAALGAHPRRG